MSRFQYFKDLNSDSLSKWNSSDLMINQYLYLSREKQQGGTGLLNFTVYFCERETKKKQGHPGEMTVLFIVSENSRLQPAPPTTPPLNNSRPIGALLYPCASAVTPLSEVSYTPFGTAETHQCPSLKQENSLIFGPWLPIHVFFLYKSYTMLHFSSEYNSTD